MTTYQEQNFNRYASYISSRVVKVAPDCEGDEDLRQELLADLIVFLTNKGYLDKGYSRGMHLCVIKHLDFKIKEYVGNKNVHIIPVENRVVEDSHTTFIRSELKEALAKSMLSLTDKERDVLSLRFGLKDGKTRSLEEVSEIFNLTRERVRQIENKAIRRLRHPSRSKFIKDFYV